MRALVTTAIEVAGAVLVVAGVWRVSAAAGMIVTGLLLVSVGVRNA